MDINERYKQFISYIKYAGGCPKIEHFDEDWEPMGKMVRDEMSEAGLIIYKNNQIYLTEDLLDNND